MDSRLLKLIIKQGLKLASPLLGSLLSDAGTEIAGILIDNRGAKIREDVVARLSSRVDAELSAILASENAETLAEPIMATLEDAIGNENSLRAVWLESGYSAAEATRRLMEQKRALFQSLSLAEVALARRLIQTLFSAAGQERHLLDATEADFRRIVLTKLDTLLEHAPPSDVRDRLISQAVLSVPRTFLIPGLSPPGALLRADIDQPVPFHGRDAELAELRSWILSDQPLALRLVTGAGGMGKTRLMVEICAFAQSNGWATGFLEKAIAGNVREVMRSALQGSKGTVAVVDYAENRRSQVIDLIAAALECYGRAKIRIILLARAADDWWEALRGEGGGIGDVIAGPGCSRVSLRPLATTLDARRASYRLAVSHFSSVLSKSIREEAGIDFGDRAFDRALLLHMAALAAVDGVSVKGDQSILDHALDRERRFWHERAQALELDALYEPAILQGIAAITLAGGTKDRNGTIRILRAVPLLRDEREVVLNAIATLLHDTYSGYGWVDPILPDLLGEHVVQSALDAQGADALINMVFGEPET